MHSYEQEGQIKALLRKVLILVLMEDALVLGCILVLEDWGGGLNPCFNGRCTRTPNATCSEGFGQS